MGSIASNHREADRWLETTRDFNPAGVLKPAIDFLFKHGEATEKPAQLSMRVESVMIDGGGKEVEW